MDFLSLFIDLLKFLLRKGAAVLGYEMGEIEQAVGAIILIVAFIFLLVLLFGHV